MFIYHDDDPFRSEEKVDRVYHVTSPSIPHDWLEKAAYYHWEKRGRPHGSSFADWMEAERQLRERLKLAPPASSPTPEPPPTGGPPHSWLV